MPEQQRTNPGLSALLSFIFNGMGQIYNGQITRGLIIVAVSTVTVLILIVGAILIFDALFSRIVIVGELVTGLVMFFFGLIVTAILGVWNIYDAYNSAKTKSRE